MDPFAPPTSTTPPPDQDKTSSQEFARIAAKLQKKGLGTRFFRVGNKIDLSSIGQEFVSLGNAVKETAHSQQAAFCFAAAARCLQASKLPPSSSSSSSSTTPPTHSLHNVQHASILAEAGSLFMSAEKALLPYRVENDKFSLSTLDSMDSELDHDFDKADVLDAIACYNQAGSIYEKGWSFLAAMTYKELGYGLLSLRLMEEAILPLKKASELFEQIPSYLLCMECKMMSITCYIHCEMWQSLDEHLREILKVITRADSFGKVNAGSELSQLQVTHEHYKRIAIDVIFLRILALLLVHKYDNCKSLINDLCSMECGESIDLYDDILIFDKLKIQQHKQLPASSRDYGYGGMSRSHPHSHLPLPGLKSASGVPRSYYLNLFVDGCCGILDIPAIDDIDMGKGKGKRKEDGFGVNDTPAHSIESILEIQSEMSHFLTPEQGMMSEKVIQMVRSEM